MPLKSGQTRKGLRNLSTGVSAIPDSAIHRYDASELSGHSDGDSVTSWPDEIGSLTLSGTGTYRPSGLNGNPAIEFDGTDNTFVDTFSAISSPYTVYAVAELTGNESNDPRIVSVSDSNGPYAPYWRQGSWAEFAGSVLTGSSDSTIQQLTAVIDGANSVIREEASQTASGDAGTDDANGIRLGGRGDNGSTNNHWQGYISEVVFCDDREIDTEFEGDLLSKWGVT